MPRDARLTDLCDHGPMIIEGTTLCIVEGLPDSRVTDLYACPLPFHGPNPIVTGADHHIVDGERDARIGDVTACGAVICTGAFTVDIG